MKKNALWLLLVLMLPAIAYGRKPEKKVTVSSGRKEEDLVTGLPGQPPVNFRHYAGYVDLGPRQKQKALFYWFFEAQHNSSGRPLVLWLNGGQFLSLFLSLVYINKDAIVQVFFFIVQVFN